MRKSTSTLALHNTSNNTVVLRRWLSQSHSDLRLIMLFLIMDLIQQESTEVKMPIKKISNDDVKA